MSKLFDKLLDVKTDLQLTKKVEVKDIKAYLENEFERAKLREDRIEELEKRLAESEKLKLKYDAMLVMQEKTTERTKRQDTKIEELKIQLEKERKENLKLRAKIADMRINAKKMARNKK